MADKLLLETGDHLLLETGDFLLLDQTLSQALASTLSLSDTLAGAATYHIGPTSTLTLLDTIAHQFNIPTLNSGITFSDFLTVLTQSIGIIAASPGWHQIRTTMTEWHKTLANCPCGEHGEATTPITMDSDQASSFTLSDTLDATIISVTPAVAKLWMSGFEEGLIDIGYSGGSGGFALSTAHPRSKGPGTSLVGTSDVLGPVHESGGTGNSDDTRLTFYWRLDSLSVGSGTLIKTLNKIQDGSNTCGLCLRASGGIAYLATYTTSNPLTSTSASSIAISAETWYRTELVIPANDGSGVVTLTVSHYLEDSVSPVGTFTRTDATIRPGVTVTWGNSLSVPTLTYTLRLDDIAIGSAADLASGPLAIYSVAPSTTTTKQWSGAVTDVDDFPGTVDNGDIITSAGDTTYDRFGPGTIQASPTGSGWVVKYAMVTGQVGGTGSNHTKFSLWSPTGSTQLLGAEMTNLAMIDQATATVSKQLPVKWASGVTQSQLGSHTFGYQYVSASGAGRVGWVYLNYGYAG